MRRTHPCNAFGWLYVEHGEYQRAMTQQLLLRDQELADNPHFSGEPEAFTPWALNHVRQLAAADPSISRQVSDRVADLKKELQRLDNQRLRQLAQWNDEEAAITGQIEQLVELAQS